MLQVFIAVDNQLAGLVTLSDMVRPDALATVSQLQQQGYHTVMLTGTACTGSAQDLHKRACISATIF